MNARTFPPRFGFRKAAMLIATVILLAVSFVAVSAQQQPQSAPPQLTLADILIALRSKKLTLPERNRILTDAVTQRGITFSLSNEIVVELQATGADQGLMDAIKKKSQIVKASAVIPPVETKPSPAPVSSPAQPDYAAYQQRADSSFARGDLDAAIIEYGKAIELKPSLVDAYLGRGRIYMNKGWYDQALADFTKMTEIDPKDPAAFANRGLVWEKKGDVQKAKADYQKALELNADNAMAKTNLERIKAEEAKAMPKTPVTPPQTTPTKPASSETVAANTNSTAAAPESIDVGTLSSADAVRLVKPVYSTIAMKSNISGRVTVKVTMDEEGNVTSAKAIDGHQLLRQSSEDAARRSKFKPATYQGKPIKATGLITYNYTPGGGTSE